MTTYEIPLDAANQRFSITLGSIDYRFTVTYRDATEGGWAIDIASSEDVPIVSGIPLVAGADLLEQYRHLGIGGGGALYLVTAGDADAVPSFDALGVTSRLAWTPDA